MYYSAIIAPLLFSVIPFGLWTFESTITTMSIRPRTIKLPLNEERI